MAFFFLLAGRPPGYGAERIQLRMTRAFSSPRALARVGACMRTESERMLSGLRRAWRLSTRLMLL